MNYVKADGDDGTWITRLPAFTRNTSLKMLISNRKRLHIFLLCYDLWEGETRVRGVRHTDVPSSSLNHTKSHTVLQFVISTEGEVQKLNNVIFPAGSTSYTNCSVRSQIQDLETSTLVLFIPTCSSTFSDTVGNIHSSPSPQALPLRPSISLFLFLSVFVTRIYITGSWLLLSKRISVMWNNPWSPFNTTESH